MRDKKFARLMSLGLILSLTLAASIGLAQGPAPQSRAAPEAQVGSTFTYQGRLSHNGSPITGEYDLRFILYDALSGGSQVGSTITKEDMTVTDGLFTAALDFGAVFDGVALWLEAAVRPGGSTGSYTILSPRQEITPAPYALYALNIPQHDHFGQSWTGSADEGLYVWNTSSSSWTAGVRGVSESADHGIGVVGDATATSGMTYGVYGQVKSSEGYAGYFANVAGGTALYAAGDSILGGTGIIHSVNNFAGNPCPIYPQPQPSGGYFEMVGTCGYGLMGEGPTGVRGESSKANGTGTTGFATASSGINSGVAGVSQSVDGRGVYGKANAASGNRYGVVGEVNGSGFGLMTLNDLYVGGTCTGCTMALIGRNTGTESLQVGDVVAVSGVGSMLKGHTTPVLEVRQATTSDPSVLGVVYTRGEFYAADASEKEDFDGVQPVAGNAAPGDYLFVVTSGLAQVRVAPALASTSPGQKLSISDAAGVATVAGVDTNPDLVFGKAMEAQADENGLIWAMISTQ